MKRFRIWTPVLIAGLLVALTPHAAVATDGYFTLGYGTKCKGMAGACLAFPQDAMCASTNPAGLVLVGSRFEIGAALFNPERQYSVAGAPSGAPGTFGLYPGTVKSGEEFFANPHMAINWMLNHNSAFGIAIYGNGGMNTHYPASASGGMGTFYGGETGVNLVQLFVTPSYSRKFGAHASWGVSAILAYQQFEARGLKNFGAFVADGTPDHLTNQGTDHAYGYGGRIGLLAEVRPGLTVAGSYQTKITMGRFVRYSDLFAEGGKFDIPASGALGIAWKPSPASVLAFDVQHIWYSDVHSVANPMSNLFTGNPADMLGGPNGAGFGWRDMTVYKLGYQWQATPTWQLRAGVAYGEQPIPSSEVLFNILAPGVQEWHFTLGFTKKVSRNGEVSMAFMYSPDKTVTGPNPFEVPGQQTISLKMHQFEAEVDYGIKF